MRKQQKRESLVAKRKTKQKPNVTHEEIVTHSIRLVDRQGNDRITMQAADGYSLVQFMGEAGVPQIELQVVDNGDATIRIGNQEDQTAISIGVNQSGNGISINAQDGTFVVMMGVYAKQTGPFSPTQGHLFIRDSATNEQFILPDPNL